MKENKEKDIPYQAGAALLNEPIKFKVPFLFGRKLTFGIRPQHPTTMVRIGMAETRLAEIDETENMMHELLQKSKNYKVFCRIIALGILNSPLKIFLFSKLLAWYLGWFVESSKEIYSYTMLIYKQTYPEHFFFTMALTGGMNMMKKKQEKSGEVTHSGES